LFGFHGTPEENLDKICQNGLDPKRRTGQALGKGEYFGTKAEVSIPYCRKSLTESVKVIVFGILCAPEGITHISDDVLVIHENSFQLPMYIVQLKLKPQHQQPYQVKTAPQLNNLQLMRQQQLMQQQLLLQQQQKQQQQQQKRRRK